MLAFESMIAPAARDAGMKIPPDELLDKEWPKEEYPHFWVFCQLQLGRSMSDWAQPWGNAKIIAVIPVEQLMLMSAEGFIRAGCDLS